VALMDLRPAGQMQMSLFPTAHNRQSLMQVMDRVNAVFGRGTLRSGAEGIQPAWRMKRERMSPAYTTRWNELAIVA
jgi:DNA polymerase V